MKTKIKKKVDRIFKKWVENQGYPKKALLKIVEREIAKAGSVDVWFKEQLNKGNAKVMIL